MKSYYNQRAREYEKVYEHPERQPELETVKRFLENSFRGKRVLEVACGTGYWTQIFAPTAQSVLAVDQSQETLEVARAKDLDPSNVTFLQDDAYSLKSANTEFNAGFAGFWWSHIPKIELRGFLQNFHSKLSPGAPVIFIDNEFKVGSSTPISKSDDEGNTYQIRQLADGSRHEILKNFPADSEFKNVLDGLAQNIEIWRKQHYWMVQYQVLE
jgi:SAM-dependent methyltransferase